jgi:hypothetical protein
MVMPSITEAARMRAAIARDQTVHWRRLFWEPARTKKELDRRERLWFWWGSTGWQAEQAAHGRWLTREQGFARGR